MLYETSLRPHAYGHVADLYNLQNVLHNKPAPKEVNEPADTSDFKQRFSSVLTKKLIIVPCPINHLSIFP